MIANNNHLTILCAPNTIIKVQVYDVLGRDLFTQNNLNTHQFEASLINVSPQMILIKVLMDDGKSYTKKTAIE